MAEGKNVAGLVVTALSVLLCLSCVGFTLLMGVVGPGGVGSAEWRRAFHADAGVDAGP